MLSFQTLFLPKPTPWLIFYPFDDAKVRLFAHTAKNLAHFFVKCARFLIWVKDARFHIHRPICCELPTQKICDFYVRHIHFSRYNQRNPKTQK